MTNGPKYEVRRMDILLLALTLVLTTIGILAVFDASYASALAQHVSQTKYVALQAGWGIVGIACLLGASRFPYWKWRPLAGIGLALSIIGLILVFAPHVGVMVKGAHRWIGHGLLRIQPSEFAKLFVVLFVARSCAGNVRIMKHFITGPLPGVVMIGIVALLIAVEPDLGTALLISAAGVATLYFAGIKKRHLFAVIACGVLLIGGMFAMKAAHGRSDYQISRLMVFLHPEKDKQGDGFQVYHSLLALGTGGATGRGIGLGREKIDLPEADTDFIFAVIGEEGGLIASLLILGLLGLTVARGMHIACTTRDRFGSLLAAGISFCIGFQAFVNIGVVTASMPATGVPLPFISYGGSSLLMSLLMMGMLLNISQFPDGDPTRFRQPRDVKAESQFYRRWRLSGGSGSSTGRSTRRQTAKRAVI